MRNKLTDEEFNLVSRWTFTTKLDSLVDIADSGSFDYFRDFEEDTDLSLKEGFEIIAAAVAYSFQHEGFTDAEAKQLERLIQEYVPSFKALDPEQD